MYLPLFTSDTCISDRNKQRQIQRDMTYNMRLLAKGLFRSNVRNSENLHFFKSSSPHLLAEFSELIIKIIHSEKSIGTEFLLESYRGLNLPIHVHPSSHPWIF